MRRAWKIALGVIAAPVGATVLLGAAGQARWDRTFEAPLPDLHASTDSAAIERGRYLVYGPAHCAACHTRQDAWQALDAGEQPPLSGGHEFKLPFGTIYTANLTPDAETGIGRMSDGEIARMLRYSVRHDGRAGMPFMEFQQLSDDDIVAVISYLRSQAPVRNAVPEHELNPLGKILLSYVIKPAGPAAQPLVHTPAEAATIERGEYVARAIANCKGCHSRRNLMDGSYIGAPYAGGQQMPLDDDPTKMFVTPNLTPDSATGHIYNWTEDQFVARFRAGKLRPSSHMPWTLFARMSDTDLRAIYRFLRSLEPVHNETGPIVQDFKK